VPALGGTDLVVHSAALSTCRLLAS
jgi:hypothetical protein